MKSSPTTPLRPALVAMAVLGSTVLLGVLGAAQDGAPPARPRPGAPTAGETAGHFYKNVKVLKKLPANQLVPTMHLINTSLGVDCGFCHVRGAGGADYASDEKPTKRMARQMLSMTQSLNAHQKILDGKATCYMCHHGHAEPETRVGLSEERTGDRAPAPPPPPPPQ